MIMRFAFEMFFMASLVMIINGTTIDDTQRKIDNFVAKYSKHVKPGPQNSMKVKNGKNEKSPEVDVELQSGAFDPEEDLQNGAYDPEEDLHSGAYDPEEDLKSGAYDPEEDLHNGAYDPEDDLNSSSYDPNAYPYVDGTVDPGADLQVGGMVDPEEDLHTGAYDPEIDLLTGGFAVNVNVVDDTADDSRPIQMSF